MASPQYWHQQEGKNKNKTLYLSIVLIILLVVGGFYYFGGLSQGVQQRGNDFKTPEKEVINGIIAIHEGRNTDVVTIGEIETTSYFVSDKTRDDVIAELLQFLTNNGWMIRSGTEIRGGLEYVISAFNEESSENMQINISGDGNDHQISLTYSKK